MREFQVASENNPNDLDEILDTEELAAIAALAPEDIQAIDDALLKNARNHWSKVALVVDAAMYAYPDRFLDIPDVFYGDRIKVLVSQGLLESQGNLSKMRFCEVRFPKVAGIANEI
jgi:Protein of unknown function